MVNFMCHCSATGCPDHWKNIVFGCVCKSARGVQEHLNHQTEERGNALQQREVASPKLLAALIERKGGGRGNSLSLLEFILFCPWTRNFCFLRPSDSSFYSISSSVLRPLAYLGVLPFVSPVHRPLDSLVLNYTTSFPGSSASKCHIVGLLKLRNYMSQCL